MIVAEFLKNFEEKMSLPTRIDFYNLDEEKYHISCLKYHLCVAEAIDAFGSKDVQFWGLNVGVNDNGDFTDKAYIEIWV